jgi:hypothetical protein
MYLNFFIILISLIIFTQSPIRFSNKNVIYKYNYNTLYTILIYTILIIELLLLLEYPLFTIYLLIIPASLLYIIIDMIKTQPIKNSKSFNPPPKYLSKSYIIYLFIIALLVYKYINTQNKLNIILIVIHILLCIQIIKFSSCKYELPISWNSI